MRLSDFPVPRNRSKRGVHWSASCYPEEHDWRGKLALCRDMGIGWIKFVDDGGVSGLNVYRACWHEYGIIPIIRFYIGTPGQCGPREADAIRRIADTLGFRTYFELCNEPDLPLEWGWKQPRNWLYLAADAYCDYAPKVLEAGGLPGTFALASGAFGQVRVDEHGNEIPPIKVNFLKLITDKLGKWIFESGGWVSMHNYHINHPVDYPYDAVNQEGRPLTKAEYDAAPPWAWDYRPIEAINAQRARDKNPGDTIWDDDTCFGAYKVFLGLLDELGLAETPIITTEGGPTLTRGDDGRYPKIYIELMCQMLEETYREMATVPRYFAYCHWLLYNTTGGWSTDCWLNGSQDYSKAINLFKTTPVGAWGEVIGTETTPPIEPPIEPPEEGDQTMPAPELEWLIPDWNEAQPRIAYIMPGERAWRLTRAELAPDNMANTVWVNVFDENGNRVNVAVKVRNVNGTVETLPFKPGEPYNRPIWKNDNLTVWIDDGPSDVVENLHGAYWNIPNVNTFHVGYVLTFQRATEPAHEEPPEPPPVEVTTQDIRNAAWNRAYPSGGMALNPEAAFQATAREWKLGCPVTNEFDIGAYRAQGFALGIVYARIGDWQNIEWLDW